MKTVAPLPTGTRVHLLIEHNGVDFIAVGMVTDNVTATGTGIEFVEVRQEERAIIEKWLPAHLKPSPE